MLGFVEPGKAKSKSVSLQPELWDRAEAKAARHYGSNRSSYIRTLIENDLAGAETSPNPTDERAVETLVSAYAPALAQETKEWFEDAGMSQRRFLAQLVYHLTSAASEGTHTPQEFLAAVETLDPELIERALKATLRRMERHALKAAEDPGPYSGPPKKKKSRDRPTGTG